MSHRFVASLIVFLAVCFGPFCESTFADLQLAGIFSDNMVLQRNMDLKVWGTADVGSAVNVQLKGQSLDAIADADGKWMVTGQPIQVGDPFEVVVTSGSEEVTLKNCVAGEVWICSGQSNMEWVLRNTQNATEVIANANYPMIRHFKVQNTTALTERDSLTGSGWQVCNTETSPEFTAVGFYFAQKLQNEIDVPIGLLNTSWGGTIVEAWTSADSLSTVPEFADRVDAIRGSAEDQAKAANRAETFQKWQTNVLAAIADESEQWQADTIDDSAWKEVNVPGYWENQGFKDVDGAIWYRKKVNIPKEWVGKDLILNLGTVDDGDKTYVNGTFVGETNAWDAKRSYPVDAKLITSNKFYVAVRVTDGNLGGGIYGEPSVSLKSGEGDSIPMNGKWKVKPTTRTESAGPKPAVAFAGPNHPTVLYNAMVEPLIPFGFRGAIWYQGESNAGRAHQYRTLFPLLINDWRSKWNREFPFYWVQLANFQKPAATPWPSNWAELREAQTMTLSLPNTGQAVIIDVGEADDIHPRDKKTVGYRLAAIALTKDYGGGKEFSGPVYKSMSASGNVVTVEFNHSDSLQAIGGELKRFELAGEDQKFHFANAKIVDGKVEVTCDAVPSPVAVRYAWASNPEGCNLYNASGFPASPFRSDSWKGITEGNK